MSITDELREIAAKTECANGRCEKLYRGDLDHTADRIDIAYKHTIGYVDDRDPETMAENEWVKLPVDADGEVIHIGDVMDKGKVTCIRDCGKGWEVILNSLYTYDAPSLHHHEPTVEDVLREFGDWYAHTKGGCDEDAIVAEYAAKLKLVSNK